MKFAKTRYKAYYGLFVAGIMLLSVMSFAGVYSGGLGTETDPYQISAVGDWQELASTPADWDAWFILTRNIDLTGVTVATVGNNSTRFTGVFDGNRHVVENLTMNTPDQDFVGLFGYVGAIGEVKNLGVVNVTIHGHEAVGGLVGRSHGRILACYASGAVSGGKWDVGGLVGSNIGGAINKCYAAVNVASVSDYVGGLTGYNLGDSIVSSYAVGTVSGLNFVGGLLGTNDKGQVMDCYSTGTAAGTSSVGGFVGINWDGSIMDCFWDTQTSGTIVSGGGIGKTTAEMKTQILYNNAGWDFDQVWASFQDGHYPHLQWQLWAADFVIPEGVGLEDFSLLSRNWLRHDCGDCEGVDLDGDSIVALSDLLLFSEQWLGGR